MNKRQKIIISIVGITIVLLALLGITYAYYLTRIEGNTNTNSISITTADLKLVYRDGNGLITKENIMPGTTIEKTFTVTNDGNSKVDNYAVYLEEVINTLSRTEDLTYVLECTSSTGDCAGTSGEFPELAGLIVTNSIDVGVTHTYKLTVTYANHETIDQSDDMGSEISAFVQIYAMKDIVDITGEVTGTNEGDYIQINSVQKRSRIVRGKYILGGVKPGSHTIKVCGKSDATCSSPKLSKTITINLGSIASANEDVITITENSQTFTIDIDLTETVESNKVIIGTTIKEYNPFEEGTLAYNIYNNSKNNKNGTILLSEPITNPGNEGSAENLENMPEKRVYFKLSDIEAYSSTENTAYDCAGGGICGEAYKEYDEAFADAVEETPISCSTVLGKYVATFDLLRYKVDGCDGEKPYQLINPESILTTTIDDYGTSYYYRGYVTDNFVNFAGMCWKIVRIAGDGSVKLILQDQDNTCEENDGNWSLGKGNYGYTYEKVTNASGSLSSYKKYVSDFLSGQTNSDASMSKMFFNWQITLANKIDNNVNILSTQYEIDNVLRSKLKSGDWCTNSNAYPKNTTSVSIQPLESNTIKNNIYNGTEFWHDSYVRLLSQTIKTPTLKCNSIPMKKFDDNRDGIVSDTESNMYVGTITIDEVLYAGEILHATTTIDHYLNDIGYWTLSQARYDNNGYYAFDTGGELTGTIKVDNNYWNIRPTISLKTNTIINKGDGTQSNPYVIK